MRQRNPVLEPSSAIYENHAPAILAYLLRRLGSREDAEDILLEVFTVVLEKETFLRQDNSSLRSWLLTIARNKVVDHYRRAGRSPHVPLADVEEKIYESEEHEPEQVFLRQEIYKQLRTHVRELPEKQQEILQLRFGEGLRCAEIAQIVGRSERAARTLLYRALKRLRNLYDNEQAERGL